MSSVIVWSLFQTFGLFFQKLLSSVKKITGLAVNWIENSVLWSNADKGTIHRMDTDGRNENTVLRDLSQPKSVVVDPNER